VDESNCGELHLLRARIAELERELSKVQGELAAAAIRALREDLLRNADQERFYVLETESAKLQEQARRFARENDHLRGIFRSDHYAGPEQMCVRPNLPPKHLGLNGNHGFLIMPFGPQWSGEVEQAVRKALSDCGMDCHRADQLLGRNIMLDIWTWICECGVVVADVTGCNPNVMYELGLAEAIGKRIILISQTPDVSFDLSGQRLIVYSPAKEKLGNLTTDLYKLLRMAASKPRLETGLSNG
jgi:hypothetical protein